MFSVFQGMVFFLLALPTKKKTNKQKQRWHEGHCNSCGQLQQAQILVKNKNKKYEETQR